MVLLEGFMDGYQYTGPGLGSLQIRFLPDTMDYGYEEATGSTP